MNYTVTTPSGKCPVTLTSDDEAIVRRWISKIYEARGKKENFSPNAYRFWVGHYFTPFSKEWNNIATIIKDVVGDDAEMS